MAELDRKSQKISKQKQFESLWTKSPQKSHSKGFSVTWADEAIKLALDEVFQHYEKCLPQNLIKWMTKKHQEKQQEKWERSTTTMKERRLFFRNKYKHENNE
jgi:hypothetical protein